MTETSERHEIEFPAGRIRYREAGEGRPVVFVHGFLVDGRLWDGVVDRLSDRCRCIAPDWPIAAHQVAMSPDADLSPYGVAATDRRLPRGARPRGRDYRRQRLGRRDVAGAGHPPPERIGRLVLTNCDTHDNFPPGIFKAMPPIAALPGG